MPNTFTVAVTHGRFRIVPRTFRIFTARAGNGLLWVVPLLHWGVDKPGKLPSPAGFRGCPWTTVEATAKGMIAGK